jgi:predicted transcriptional regulator
MSSERAGLLLSVRPRFAEAILSGTKTVEVRRRRIGATEGSPVVLYASSPVMAVVGTARLERTEVWPVDTAWAKYGHTMGISEAEFKSYLDGTRLACLLFLSCAAALRTPLSLDQLRNGRRFYPPQSYRYVGTSDPRSLQKLARQ